MAKFLCRAPQEGCVKPVLIENYYAQTTPIDLVRPVHLDSPVHLDGLIDSHYPTIINAMNHSIATADPKSTGINTTNYSDTHLLLVMDRINHMLLASNV